MKVRKILAFVLVLFAVSVQAQQSGRGKLSGKIIDSVSGGALEYASVTLLELPAGKAVNGGVTDKSGKFLLKDIKPGRYALLVESIGYIARKTDTISIEASTGLLELDPIPLAVKQNAMAAITVTTGGKLVTNKIDKMIYNAERDITSQNGVATDVLKKVPQVSVDVNGNVELAGSASIRFLINGKPSTAFGNSVADVLQSIPASQIKSIEVVTNPGAKYDAQGLGGIINIVLKQNNSQGINGNIALAAGTRANNGSFNFNARKGNFGANAFISGSYRPALDAPVTTDRTSSDTVAKTSGSLHQEGVSRFNRGGFQTGLGFDWSPNKQNSITGSLAYDRFGNKGDGYLNQRQLIYSMAGTTDISSQTLTNSRSWTHAIDAGINYKKTFRQEDRELDFSWNSSFGRSFTSADNYQLRLPAYQRFYGNTSANPGKENETEINLDYTQPLRKDVNLGVGAKYTQVDIQSTSEVQSFQQASNSYAMDPFLSNHLNYHQKVYAGYAELSFPISNWFDAKVGGRYERTNINSFFSNAQQQGGTPGYDNFVPSLFFSRKLGEKQLMKLSYAKRINRPDYGDLNPFINTSDPKNLSTGNPNLQPEVSHRIELGYNRDLGRGGSFSATAFYRMNEMDIQPFIRYYSAFQVGDSIYTNVAVSRRENIGKENNMGFMFFNDLHPSASFGVRTNLMLFYRRTINQQDIGYNSTSLNYRFNINATYQFSPDLVAEAFGNFNSARNEAQGKYPSFATYSLAIRKQFWDKKGSLALTATNPFANALSQRTELFGPGFTIYTVRQVPMRSFGISFTWKFGRLEFKKEKEPADPALPMEG